MASSEIQNLARQLIAFQAAQSSASDTGADAVAQVVEELRLRLVRLAGADGFRSLLSRALTLAKAEVPSLQSVQVRANGTLEGFDVEPVPRAASDATEAAGTILVASLLELLATFIGEQITLHLVRDAWPDAHFYGANLSTEEKA
jgi:hypothetical protein